MGSWKWVEGSHYVGLSGVKVAPGEEMERKAVAVRGGVRWNSAALPRRVFCGMFGLWANDVKRASAQCSSCFSMT